MPVIVLAGGRSLRMGRPKALLPWPQTGAPFVTHVTDTFLNAGADCLGVVTGAHHDAIAPVLEGRPVTVLYNPDHAAGQLASLLHGLRWAFAQTTGSWVMATLVDVPAVRPETVRALAEATLTGDFLAIRPRSGGRHGHPVVWRRDILPRLEAADPALGARAVMRDLAAEGAVRDVDVDDPGVLTDVDTPEQYAAFVKGSTRLTPPLKWAGGKRWQLPHLRPLWQPHTHRRLVEPFCGGLAVTIGLSPERALLNDVNPYLMSFYRWLRRGLTIAIALENDETVFYEHRKRFNQLLAAGQGESAEAASLFYFLNRTGYNGLCRFNKSGQFNVPFGSYTQIPYERDLTRFRDAFARWEFTVGDFEEIPLEPGDFVYADPPYDVDFRQYAQGGFPWADQVRTAEWLATHRGPVILVNQATARIAGLYEKLGYSISHLDAPRRIACTGDRTPAREIVATRNL